MSRVNIDDSLYKDDSFIKLIIKVQSKRIAIGMVVEAFTLAQEHYLTTANDRLIPLNEWKRNGLADELIEVGFAEVQDKGIYVRGSKEQFSWLIQKQNAGIKSAEAKKSRKPSKTKSKERNQRTLGPDERASTDDNGSQPLTLSLPLSSSSSSSSSLFSPGALVSPESKTLGSRIFNAYAAEYKIVHGAEPVRDAAANSICKAIGKSLGEDGPEVARFYVQHKDYNYVKAMHPLTLLKRDSSALRTQWFTGKTMTQAKAQAAQRTSQAGGAFAKHIEPKSGSKL